MSIPIVLLPQSVWDDLQREDEERAAAQRMRQGVERTLEAMYGYELAGSEEGARELRRSTEPPPECESDAFFQELPNAGKPVTLPDGSPGWSMPITLEFEPVPYRNVLITRILPPDLSEPGVACRTCGALACTKNHAEFM